MGYLHSGHGLLVVLVVSNDIHVLFKLIRVPYELGFSQCRYPVTSLSHCSSESPFLGTLLGFRDRYHGFFVFSHMLRFSFLCILFHFFVLFSIYSLFSMNLGISQISCTMLIMLKQQ